MEQLRAAFRSLAEYWPAKRPRIPEAIASMTQRAISESADDAADGATDVGGSRDQRKSHFTDSKEANDFDKFFLNGSTLDGHLTAAATVLRVVTQHAPKDPYSGLSPEQLAAVFATIDAFPSAGTDAERITEDLEILIRNSVSLSHPRTIGHLLAPPAIPALLAEILISALNQSLDVFETSPAATIIEQALIDQICREFGLPESADGTFTPGGTHSNYAALLLARDHWLDLNLDWPAKRLGLPPDAHRFRIVCSEAAHFSIEKAAAQLGLGTNAVVRVDVDDDHRIVTAALRKTLNRLRREGDIPIALVATAGTTDFGAIDDLMECAQIAAQEGIWLHVDAAYGGGLAFSERFRSRLEGVDLADSVSIDFHKMLWQPASCGLLLLADSSRFGLTTHRADYLNPLENKATGIPDLVDKSLLTTRRFDALKVWLTLRTLGRQRIDEMIGRVLHLAQRGRVMIDANNRLELLHKPELGCLVFRYRTAAEQLSDDVNRQIHQRLMRDGRAMIATTRIRGRVCMKLTLLNPLLREEDLWSVIDEINEMGARVEASLTVASDTDGI
ncbi:pyridoxal phosphate-dependent decarboxylase family protein [Micromonospora sp. DT44]|uniref:pyridoxal phosphate-dependent decarboxylase family protein n=1 Tax=Micromonospora sp. DT44 TaxID=3393439 RepID=UPI003CF81D61